MFRRVVLKLSGEALMGDEPYGIDPERIAAYGLDGGKLLLRQYQMLYGEGLERMKDLCYLIAINTRRLGEAAARQLQADNEGAAA